MGIADFTTLFLTQVPMERLNQTKKAVMRLKIIFLGSHNVNRKLKKINFLIKKS